METEDREIRIDSPRGGELPALLKLPERATSLLVLAHGAGAGMRHPFMEAIAERLAAGGMGTLRFPFPYMDQGRRSPDRPAILQDTIRNAIALAEREARGLPLLAGGKSMGGRMASLTVSETGAGTLRGIVFFGFPLHAAGKPAATRAEHLAKVELPMLFLQGTRDKLAELELLTPICDELGARARLHVVEGGDHGFHVLKRSGRSDEDVLDELAQTTCSWAARLQEKRSRGHSSE